MIGRTTAIHQLAPALARLLAEPTRDTYVALKDRGCENARHRNRCGRGDPSGFLEISAADVVYFDPYQPRRLNGIDELRALYESIRGAVSIARYELIDPR